MPTLPQPGKRNTRVWDSPAVLPISLQFDGESQTGREVGDPLTEHSEFWRELSMVCVVHIDRSESESIGLHESRKGLDELTGVYLSRSRTGSSIPMKAISPQPL